MNTNHLNSMSIFDFVDDIDAFIDEWYEFHEAVYQESIPLQTFHKVKYLNLNFDGISVEEDDAVSPIVDVSQTLKNINPKTRLRLVMIDYPSIFLKKEIVDGQFSDGEVFAEAA